MKRFISSITICSMLVSVVVLINSCKKEKQYNLITPGSFVHFNGGLNQTYQMVTNPAPVYNVTVGTTDVASVDRTATVNISSPTGAVAGTHYTVVGSNILTIPAGQTTTSLKIQGNQSQYTGSRKDTLVFTLSTPSIAPASFLDTVKLYLRGACLESDINATGIGSMLGSYTKTFENGSYGPYTTTMTSLVPVNSTSAKASITNIYDSGITAQFTFNYPTSGVFTVTMVDQSTPFTSGGLPLLIRMTPGQTSTFTYCTPTLKLYLDLYTSAGLYDRWLMTMAR